MTNIDFTFDAEANGWLSEPITIERQVMIHVELAAVAPLVTLKQEPDGEFAVYGQSPEDSDQYETKITTSEEEVTIKLAAPVEVKNCYIMN